MSRSVPANASRSEEIAYFTSMGCCFRASISKVRVAHCLAFGVPFVPEVRAIAKRRQSSAAYELSVLEEADRCSRPGRSIGALLRREGLYSSHLTTWRREREAGALEALGRRRGRKAKLSPEQLRIAELQSRCARAGA